MFEGRGVYVCCFKTKTGDNTSWNGPAQGRGQRCKKRVRCEGNGIGSPTEAWNPSPACQMGSLERGRVVVDPFMVGAVEGVIGLHCFCICSGWGGQVCGQEYNYVGLESEGGDQSTDRMPSDLEDPPETRELDSAVTLFTGSLFPPVSFKFLRLRKDTTLGYRKPGWGFGVGLTQG